MKREVNSSTAFKWVVAGIDSDKARRLRDNSRSPLVELIAPDIFPAEIASALLTPQRKGRISDFRPPLFDVLAEGLVLHETTPLLARVGRIIAAATTGVRFSVYDCLYVALAEQEGCELLTADQKLINNLQPTFPFITSLASLP